jgi:hypothetical protein
MDGREPLVDDDVVAVAAEADAFVINLECCLSDRGRRWSDRAKACFLPAPPAAAPATGRDRRVDCVTPGQQSRARRRRACAAGHVRTPCRPSASRASGQGASSSLRRPSNASVPGPGAAAGTSQKCVLRRQARHVGAPREPARSRPSAQLGGVHADGLISAVELKTEPLSQTTAQRRLPRTAATTHPPGVILRAHPTRSPIRFDGSARRTRHSRSGALSSTKRTRLLLFAAGHQRGAGG